MGKGVEEVEPHVSTLKKGPFQHTGPNAQEICITYEEQFFQ